MILSFNGQVKLFLSTVIVGAFLGLIYDFFRIFRKNIPHPDIMVQIEDFLFWTAVLGVMFAFMFHENFGEIRFFSIFGAFLGMIIYFLTVSRWVVFISDSVINAFIFVAKIFIEIIMTPFKLVFMVVGSPVKKTKKVLKNKSKNILHLCKVCAKIRIKNFKNDLKIIGKKK